MFLKRVQLKNFRNYDNCEAEFSENVNYIVGGNAQGKTNLLEAAYLLCLARSFRGVSDEDLTQLNYNGYELSARFCSDLELEDRVTLIYSRSKGKQISINGKKLVRFSDLIGRYPVISLTTMDHQITSGPPADRRHFFDVLLSQISSKYLENLREYRRILKQKNKILQELIARQRSVHRATLDTWNQRLVILGSQLILDREKYCQPIAKEFNRIYNSMVAESVRCDIIYRPNVMVRSDQTLESQFEAQLADKMNQELKSGMGLVGPHRDEFSILINNIELRKYGSRGEHKTALMALKGSEMHLIIEKRAERPMLLLDDLYSELDLDRSTRVSGIFQNKGQIFISATSLDKSLLDATHQDLFRSGKVFNVKNGTIKEIRYE